MSYMKNYRHKFSMFKTIIGREDPIIVEVGSHYGEDTLRFLETFKNPSIYCFEPDPRNIIVFKKYVKEEKVKLYESALSDFNGKSLFFQSYIELEENLVPHKYDWVSKEDYFDNKLNSSGASSLKKGYGKTFDKPIKIDVIKGSSWMKENKIKEIDLLWVDVQGSEKEVIQGFGTSLNKANFIWIEYGETMYEGGMTRQETINLLSDYGFVCIENLSDKGLQGDLLFVNDKVVVDGRIVC